MLTDEQWEEVEKIYETISDEIKELLYAYTVEGVSPEVGEAVREKLMEQFRFWID